MNLDTKYSKCPSSYAKEWEHFITIFRNDVFEYIEYSYTSNPEFLGTMIKGSKGMFLDNIIKFNTMINDNCNEGVIRELIDLTKPGFLFFKVDWLNCKPMKSIIYLRYYNEIPYRDLIKALPKEISNKLLQFISNTTEAMVKNLSIIGIRNKCANLGISIYFDIRTLEDREFQKLLNKSADTLCIPYHTLTWLEKVLDKLKYKYKPAFMGIDLSSFAIKIDFAKVEVRDFLNLSQLSDIQSKRAEDLRMISRYLKKSELSYLGIKGDHNSETNWKAYFAVSQRHSI